MFEVLLGTAITSALLLIYPYIIYPILLHALPKRPIRTGTTDLSATLVFCAFNEEASLPEKIENLMALKEKYPNLEILAYDDMSTDQTRVLLEKRNDILQVLSEGRNTGKAHGMKLMAKEAKGDILIFTDANVVLQLDAVERILSYFASDEIGGVCGSLRYTSTDNTSTASVGSIYWRLEEHMKGLESLTGNVMGADGSIFAIRRSLYPDFPDTVLDDLTVSMEVVFKKKRLIIADDVIASERLVTKRSDEFRRKIRIAARAFHTHRFLLPNLKQLTLRDKFKYISRKYIRWFGGGTLVIFILSALSAALLLDVRLALLTALAIGICAYFGLKNRSGMISSIMEIVIALLATQIGVFQAMNGKTYTTWKPAKSR